MSKKFKTYATHLGLFILTFITTTYAGAGWQDHSLEGWAYFSQGLPYSLTFLFILLCHEMGHYIFARKYKIDVSLPYFLPFLPYLVGTAGAVIRMNKQVASRRQVFDIGIAGPLAGLVVILIVMAVGFATLPPREDIYRIHPDYKRLDSLYGNYEKVAITYSYMKQQDSLAFVQGAKADSVYKAQNKIPADSIPNVFIARESYSEFKLGSSLMFKIFGSLFTTPDRIPPPYELIHYPILMAALFGLFFTGLNLLPIGQLDGGHVIYGLFGFKSHLKISRVIFTAFIFIGGIGIFKNNIFDINIFQAELLDAVLLIAGYAYFLVQVFSRAYPNRRDLLMVSTIVLAGQFAIEIILPDWEGFHGWLFFGFIVGRFLGIHHPPAFIEEPLDMKRKILGWVCLALFFFCFVPSWPVEIIEIMP